MSQPKQEIDPSELGLPPGLAEEQIVVKKGDDFWDQDRKLTSNSLATFIIDALVVAKIIKKEDLEKGIAIATEEIDVRKAAGDY